MLLPKINRNCRGFRNKIDKTYSSSPYRMCNDEFEEALKKER